MMESGNIDVNVVKVKKKRNESEWDENKRKYLRDTTKTYK